MSRADGNFRPTMPSASGDRLKAAEAAIDANTTENATRLGMIESTIDNLTPNKEAPKTTRQSRFRHLWTNKTGSGPSRAAIGASKAASDPVVVSSSAGSWHRPPPPLRKAACYAAASRIPPSGTRATPIAVSTPAPGLAVAGRGEIRRNQTTPEESVKLVDSSSRENRGVGSEDQSLWLGWTGGSIVLTQARQAAEEQPQPRREWTAEWFEAIEGQRPARVDHQRDSNRLQVLLCQMEADLLDLMNRSSGFQLEDERQRNLARAAQQQQRTVDPNRGRNAKDRFGAWHPRSLLADGKQGTQQSRTEKGKNEPEAPRQIERRAPLETASTSSPLQVLMYICKHCKKPFSEKQRYDKCGRYHEGIVI